MASPPPAGCPALQRRDRSAQGRASSRPCTGRESPRSPSSSTRPPAGSARPARADPPPLRTDHTPPATCEVDHLAGVGLAAAAPRFADSVAAPASAAWSPTPRRHASARARRSKAACWRGCLKAGSRPRGLVRQEALVVGEPEVALLDAQLHAPGDEVAPRSCSSSSAGHGMEADAGRRSAAARAARGSKSARAAPAVPHLHRAPDELVAARALPCRRRRGRRRRCRRRSPASRCAPGCTWW